ncbi:hypothetical protein ACFXKC_55520 [Streptomyces sp. NPDC059340]|uniref:hypothetical protein n=1 Tax=Streptomyces sp. NPDC059340 TaxID=3346806 RepID=UPI0036A7B317
MLATQRPPRQNKEPSGAGMAAAGIGAALPVIACCAGPPWSPPVPSARWAASSATRG